jgi:hypothetical protein
VYVLRVMLRVCGEHVASLWRACCDQHPNIVLRTLFPCCEQRFPCCEHFVHVVPPPSVGVLDRQTYQGGTRGSRLCGGDRDRETKNSKVCARTRDTRFIQVRAAKVASPTSCLGIKYGALRLVLGWDQVRCPTRYPALLYIVQGAGS